MEKQEFRLVYVYGKGNERKGQERERKGKERARKGRETKGKKLSDYSPSNNIQ